MRIPAQAEPVVAKRIGQWTFYRRNGPPIAALKAAFDAGV
jgi:hypothetical protein